MCSLERKSDQVRRLLREGEVKGALRIAKGFTKGITYAQQRSMSLAYECMVHPSFYQQLGYDLENIKASGIDVLKQLFAEKT